MSREEARRQGAITHVAFQLLGKERAIAYLNTPHADDGAHPLAQATRSDAGHALVTSELQRIGEGCGENEERPVEA